MKTETLIGYVLVHPSGGLLQTGSNYSSKVYSTIGSAKAARSNTGRTHYEIYPVFARLSERPADFIFNEVDGHGNLIS